MIYILTLNPSIDYHLKVNDCALGKTNRATEEILRVGGKGINLAIVLNNLGVASTLMGFAGGFTGNFIRDQLDQYEHIRYQFIETQAPSRINVKIRSKEETEVNGQGSPMRTQDIEALESMMHTFNTDDFVVISGSVPQGMSYVWYTKICRELHEKAIPFIVDVDNKEILNMIKYQPFLIKPNLNEFESIMGNTYSHISQLIEDGQGMLSKGPKYALVSLGKEGSVLFTEDHVYRVENPDGTLHNSVGSGDSMVAGFIAGITRGYDVMNMYRLACAAGTATAFSEELATASEIEILLDKIKIKEIK